jgi:hypothetical protein
MQVRSVDAAEIVHLARSWHDGWHRTHALLVPPELTRLRTIDRLRELLQAALSGSPVAGWPSFISRTVVRSAVWTGVSS